MLNAEPNLTGVTRSAVVTVGSARFTAYQSSISRNADFNNDGSLDLLWRHRDGRIATWRMNRLQMIDGTLLSPSQGDRNMTAVGATDFDASGSTDVLWQNTTTGAPALWLMTGTSVLAADSVSFPGATQSSWKIRAVADFNRDGYPDLVWQDQSTGSVFVWFMASAGYIVRYLGPNPLGPGVVDDPNWTIVGSGDFNRDGWPDLIWQHQTDGRIAIWKMQRTTLLEGSLISPGQVTDLDWKIRAVGDMNGDDMPDLIWQHRADGRVAVWVMNGTSMVYGIVIAQVPDTGWEIVGPR